MNLKDGKKIRLDKTKTIIKKIKKGRLEKVEKGREVIEGWFEELKNEKSYWNKMAKEEMIKEDRKVFKRLPKKWS